LAEEINELPLERSRRRMRKATEGGLREKCREVVEEKMKRSGLKGKKRDGPCPKP